MKPYRLYYLLLLATLAAPSLAGQPPVLALDVGHSKAHPGAISARGKPEFEFNAALAASVRERLVSNGARVIEIGADGNMTGLPARTQTAKTAGARFFLSIHHDSVQPQYLKPWQWRGLTLQHSEHASGFSLFVSRQNPQLAASLKCAGSIGAAFKQKGLHLSAHHAEKIAGENKTWADQNNGVYYYDNLVVLKTAAMPAVLLEAGVIINREEELRLQKAEIQDAIATSIEKGLFDCGVLKNH